MKPSCIPSWKPLCRPLLLPLTGELIFTSWSTAETRFPPCAVPWPNLFIIQSRQRPFSACGTAIERSPRLNPVKVCGIRRKSSKNRPATSWLPTTGMTGFSQIIDPAISFSANKPAFRWWLYGMTKKLPSGFWMVMPPLSQEWIWCTRTRMKPHLMR